MLQKKEHIGIALNGESLNIVSARATGGKIALQRFHTLNLVSPIEETVSKSDTGFAGLDSDDSADDIFGIDDNETLDLSDESEELSLDDVDLLESEPDEVGEIDLVDESDQPDTNELLLFNYLSFSGKNRNKFYLGLNILSGNTNFQIIRGTDYSKTKKKDLDELIQGHLERVYGTPPAKDRYNVTVRDDGSLLIASIDRDPSILSLINHVNELSHEKIMVEDVIPDEIALSGLYRVNYSDNNQTITGLIQLGIHQSRVIFFKGHEIFQISPVINEGTSHKSFLNTIYSKILFQLDSGEIPGIDRIIIADNTLGEKPVNFFKKNFPDISVENFELDEEKFSIPEEYIEEVSKFTTAIAIAVKTAGIHSSSYSDLSLLPDYISDRQKIFKLEWHGIILLIAIGLSPIVLNQFYQVNADRIEDLQIENSRYESLISEITPVVDATRSLEEILGQQQGQITLLSELVQGTIRWTVSIDQLNLASQNIGNIWITSMRESSEGLNLEGFALSEDRIPMFARQFSQATLRNVRVEEVRERDIYYFSLLVNSMFGDETPFTPENLREIEPFTDTNTDS